MCYMLSRACRLPFKFRTLTFNCLDVEHTVVCNIYSLFSNENDIFVRFFNFIVILMFDVAQTTKSCHK